MQSNYLFVYGTLRRDFPGQVHTTYLQNADFIAPAKIRGQLFLVADYPGLVLSDTDQWARGEVYLLKDESQLHQLDVYEGCAKHSPQPHEYERRLLSVTLNDSSTLEAWVYVFLQPTHDVPLIRSGDFLAQLDY